MAAAYLFHIVKNHAFLDGNKRTALVAALVFLDINGVSLERDDERLYELTMAAASCSRCQRAR
jgi:death-on-curing protein